MTAVNGAIAAAGEQVFYGKPLTFSHGNHQYRWGGKHVPGVTTILGNTMPKMALIQWAADMAVEHIEGEVDKAIDEFGRFDGARMAIICEAARKAHAVKRDKGADIGTQVHSYARDCLRANHLLPMPETGPVRKACEAFAEWFSAAKIFPIGVERMVFSETGMFAGTCDFFGRINGHLSVLDFKTGRYIYPEAWLQLCGYQMAIEEELRIRVSEPMIRWVVHLNKETGVVKVVPRGRNDAHMEWWLSCLLQDRKMRACPDLTRREKEE